jgi:exopolysaccharide biosynthesis polyprenyl glycosylphosphotransferase
MPEYYAAAWVISLLLVDGYSVQIPISRGRSLAAVGKAAPLVIAFTGLLFFALPYHVNRPVALLAVALGASSVLFYRLTVARVLLHSALAIRAVVIGRDHASADLRDALVDAQHEFNVVGSLDVPNLSLGFPASQLAELQSLMEQTAATEVVVSDEAAAVPGLVEACLESGLHLTLVAAIVEQYERRVRLTDIDNRWFLDVSGGAVWRRPYMLVRRITDLLLCAVLGIPFLIVLPLLAAAIRLESPGPVYLRQLRLGQFGKPMRIVKLRSMRADAEANGAQWAAKSDPRVTKVGRVLRRTRLDEFCQLWNVLRGEMTLIGPRPERPEFMSQLATHLPHYRSRMMVKPGLTGWAQVRHGYTANTEEAATKLEYDLYYVKNQSMALDLQILALTMFTVLGLRGR